MSDPVRAPAKRPCGSCPYRRDVPSGVWSPEEYAKLPPYDEDTPYQPMGLFMCHQQDGRLCAGWVGCHDMGNTLAVRLGIATGAIPDDVLDAILDYRTDVALFSSGDEALVHGMTRIADPDPAAHRTIAKIERKQARRATP